MSCHAGVGRLVANKQFDSKGRVIGADYAADVTCTVTHKYQRGAYVW